MDSVAINALSRRFFYIVSLSCNTLTYKGMLTARQLAPMFPDLSDPSLETCLALVHQRFSTNTFPSWPLAHPYRYVAHNGEINTLRGNINWMRARQGLLQSDLLGDDLKKVLPVIREGGSDTAIFDNVLEFLTMTGRSLPHAILMMIPEPWSGNDLMDADRKAFYEYHSSLMEPWDGPASIAFTDGTVIGAVLDRNGLRPSRYYVTKDDLVVMASEVGVLDIPPEDVLVKERLHPGRIFLIDTAKGRIVDDDEIKRELAAQHPYREWIDSNLVDINDLPPARAEQPDHHTVLKRQQAFGYTQEDLRVLIGPMAIDGAEPVGSMGTDTSLAVLSDKPRLLYDYFKQLFAQVTNPPLDAIREELVTSMGSTIGPERNLLKPEPESCRQIGITCPIIHNEHVAKLRHLPPDSPFRSTTLQMTFDPQKGGAGLDEAMNDLCRRASEAVAAGYDILILSDRGVGPKLAPIPSLMATAGVHHHLVREGHAHPLRARRRVRRRARSAPRLAAARLRRGCRQPVSRVRDDRRHDCARPHRGRDARGRDRSLRQGAQQGHPQGDVQDGHLDARELLRRADLRGHRAAPGVHRPVLHAHDVACRRRRHRRHREGSMPAPRARLRPPARGRGRAESGWGIPVAA
mgnify:CR=1 FL=1